MMTTENAEKRLGWGMEMIQWVWILVYLCSI